MAAESIVESRLRKIEVELAELRSEVRGYSEQATRMLDEHHRWLHAHETVLDGTEANDGLRTRVSQVEGHLCGLKKKLRGIVYALVALMTAIAGAVVGKR